MDIPESYLRLILKTRNITPEPLQLLNNEPTETIISFIPYVRGISKKTRIRKEYNIRTAFKTKNTIRGNSTRVKPEILNKTTENCIYCLLVRQNPHGNDSGSISNSDM